MYYPWGNRNENNVKGETNNKNVEDNKINNAEVGKLGFVGVDNDGSVWWYSEKPVWDDDCRYENMNLACNETGQKVRLQDPNHNYKDKAGLLIDLNTLTHEYMRRSDR
ncbi:hypothetical protein M0R19_08125 [Candidatus Pacearchaeota archaeon]|nr:hypothetical protein [Candidatus Pacearchaeota archaeon]